MLTSSRTTNILLITMIAVGIAIAAMLATGVRGGPLDPPGPPASTQSNVIYQPASCAAFPIVLSTPGSYRLGGNITGCASKDGIQITASNISLDLEGFSVLAAADSLNGIASVGEISSLKITNGLITGWGGTGLYLRGSDLTRVDNIIATRNADAGIELGATSSVTHSTSSRNGGAGFLLMATADNSTISDCNADFNSTGIAAIQSLGTTIRQCAIGNNASVGIEAGAYATITNSHIHDNLHGIFAEPSCTIADNVIESNDDHGVFVFDPSSNCTIVRNKSNGNGSNGFTLPGSARALIDGNHAAGNAGLGFSIGAGVPGNPNIITRNAASGNIAGNYTIGLNNDAAPTAVASSTTNALANISN